MPNNNESPNWIHVDLFDKALTLDQWAARPLFPDKLKYNPENIPLRYGDKIIGKAIKIEIVDNKINATFEIYGEMPKLDKLENFSISGNVYD